MEADDKEKIDFSTLSYEEWLRLIFDRPIYWDVGIGIESPFEPAAPIVLVEHLTRLCNEFASLHPRFSWEQINQGIWAILMVPVNTADVLMSDKVPQQVRIDCIRSMFEVFSGTVATNEYVGPYTTCFDMWWDIICSRFAGLGHKIFIPSTEEEKMTHDVLLETLSRILAIENSACQSCALHGLGHLHHPKVFELVDSFIESHKEGHTEEDFAWVRQCRDGTVM